MSAISRAAGGDDAVAVCASTIGAPPDRAAAKGSCDVASAVVALRDPCPVFVGPNPVPASAASKPTPGDVAGR
ncbi:hypothetical protein [Sphingomonas sp. Leaf198]|uniref:hypothetical protein n=1 Tax=Sphingomonas sp. Leaf198 TaxID=1736299 RepID=UPI0006F80CF6|nr:hypothetical protein [Sphingomonas sp. Leaf198]KQS46945.1 hypothetical protein ASG20_17000 [Sphingomonas sp. Leaf198]